MALADVVFTGNNSSVANRGNVGVVADSCSSSVVHKLTLSTPAPADVLSGVLYGQQGSSLTGTLVGGSGGGEHSYTFQS